MSWWRNRWYLWVGLLVWAPTGLLWAAATFISLGPLDRRTATFITYAHALTYLWLFWACPYLDALNLAARSSLSPRWRLLWLQYLIWGPAQLVGAYALAWWLAGVFVPLAMGYRGTLGTALWARAVMLAMLAFTLIPPSYLIARRLRQRFLRTLRAQRLCYACGYDLRATSGPACPECGGPATGPTP